MKSVTAPELARWLRDETRPQPLLLDVREPWEFQICRIEGSKLIPIRTLAARLDELDRERPIVCVCHHGNRSAHVAIFLMHQGFADVYNLTGGVDAWSRQVDPAMPVY
ncbi:MAG: rhodanese-like domain-containing protein [Burkholderiaceae bacterium]